MKRKVVIIVCMLLFLPDVISADDQISDLFGKIKKSVMQVTNLSGSQYKAQDFKNDSYPHSVVPISCRFLHNSANRSFAIIDFKGDNVDNFSSIAREMYLRDHPDDERTANRLFDEADRSAIRFNEYIKDDLEEIMKKRITSLGSSWILNTQEAKKNHPDLFAEDLESDIPLFKPEEFKGVFSIDGLCKSLLDNKTFEYIDMTKCNIELINSFLSKPNFHSIISKKVIKESGSEELKRNVETVKTNADANQNNNIEGNNPDHKSILDGLCETIQSIKVQYPISTKECNSDKVKKILEYSSLYDAIYRKNRDEQYSQEIVGLINDTKRYRKKSYHKHPPDIQNKLKNLNLALLLHYRGKGINRGNENYALKHQDKWNINLIKMNRSTLEQLHPFEVSKLSMRSDSIKYQRMGKKIGAKYILTGTIENIKLDYDNYETARKLVEVTSKEGARHIGKKIADESDTTAGVLLGTAIELGGLIIGGITSATIKSFEGWNIHMTFNKQIIDVDSGECVLKKKINVKVGIGRHHCPSHKVLYEALNEGIEKAISQVQPDLLNYLGASGHIIGTKISSDGKKRAAVLNVGYVQGVKEGDYFEVFNLEEIEDPESKSKKCWVEKLPVKLMIIAKPENNTSLAIIEGDSSVIKRVRTQQVVEVLGKDTTKGKIRQYADKIYW